jgi:hypothetical protein
MVAHQVRHEHLALGLSVLMSSARTALVAPPTLPISIGSAKLI